MSDEGLALGKRLSEIRQQQGLSQRRAAETLRADSQCYQYDRTR